MSRCRVCARRFDAVFCNFDELSLVLAKTIKFYEHNNERFQAELVSRGYRDFCTPVCFVLRYFTVADTYNLSYPQTSVGQGFLLYSFCCALDRIFIFPIGCMNVAFSRISVFVRNFIYSAGGQYWRLLTWRCFCYHNGHWCDYDLLYHRLFG